MMRPGSGAVRSLTDRVGKAQPSAGYVPRLTPPSQTATASVSSRPAPQGGAGWSTQDWAERRSRAFASARKKLPQPDQLVVRTSGPGSAGLDTGPNRPGYCPG